MKGTLHGFCRWLLESLPLRRTLNPEWMAAAFVDYFRVSCRPTLEELTLLLKRAGFGHVTGRDLESMKGIHYSAPGGGYHIHYRKDLWAGAQDYTVLHEAYEIIHETLTDLYSGYRPGRKICREGDRFSAAVLMQPKVFLVMALASGLDVLALQRMYRCSYASVAMRLAEVVRHPPLMVVLYENTERGDPAGWEQPPSLTATVVKKTRGMSVPNSFTIRGARGGVPRRGSPPSPGSLADLVIRCGRTQSAREGGHTVVARPVFWKGKLAKVVVVAVPERDSSILDPQVMASSIPGRGYRRSAVGMW